MVSLLGAGVLIYSGPARLVSLKIKFKIKSIILNTDQTVRLLSRFTKSKSKGSFLSGL